MPEVFAAADIGSNTVHLLIARSNGTTLQRMTNQSEWLALGEAVGRTGEIPADRLELLLQLLRDYENLAKASGARQFYVFATEAMRAAKNGPEVLERIRNEAGIPVHLISPREEAELSFQGVSLDASHIHQGSGVLLEVGGGSAQVAICEDDQIVAEFSLPIGTGKLVAVTNLENPASPESVSAANAYLDEQIAILPERVATQIAVASGGVARGFLRALHPDGDKTIYLDELSFIANSCARLGLDVIVNRLNVKPKRAAALLPGALIYLKLMQRLGISQIFVSEFGVREGAILELAKGTRKAWHR